MRTVEVRRHAERDAEENLTPRGLAQAARARETLEFPYDAYARSPAKRAKLTMEAFGILDAVVEERIAPRPRPPFAAYDARHAELVRGGADPVTAWFAIAECGGLLLEHGRRALAAILDLAAKLPEEGRALVVSHGGTIEPMAVAALGRPYGHLFGRRQVGNCEGVRFVEVRGGVARVDVIRMPSDVTG